MAQTIKPDLVVLWVAEGDAASLPSLVSGLVDEGLHIGLCQDLGSYKKIIPTLNCWAESFIAIADDDVCYSAGWLESLVNAYLGGRPAVIAGRARILERRGQGRFAPYKEWKLAELGGQEGRELVPTGVGGVLYPPGSLRHDTLDSESFLRLAPNGDDLWLYWKSRQAGFTTRMVDNISEPRTWNGSQKAALWSNVNVEGRSANDQHLKDLMDNLGVPF